MIPNPDTLARIREQAKGHAEQSIAGFRHLLPVRTSDTDAEIEAAIRRAYLAGADAGYLARIAEERK